MSVAEAEVGSRRPARETRRVPAAPVKPRDIIGNYEVRALIGRQTGRPKMLDRHTLIRWRNNEGFPEPIRKLKGTPQTELWNRQAVLRWLRDTGRA